MGAKLSRRARTVGAAAAAALLAGACVYLLLFRRDRIPPIEGVYSTEGGLGVLVIKKVGWGKYAVEHPEFFRELTWPDSDVRVKRTRRGFKLAFRPKIAQGGYVDPRGDGSFEFEPSQDGSDHWDLVRFHGPKFTWRMGYMETVHLYGATATGLRDRAKAHLAAAREVITTEYENGPEFSGRFPRVVFRIDDARLANYFKAQHREKNPGRAFQIAEQLIQRFPDEPRIRMVALEAAFYAGDLELLGARVAEWRTGFAAPDDAYLRRAPHLVDRALRILRANAEGKNYWSIVRGWETRSPSAEDLIRDTSEIWRYEAYLPINATFDPTAEAASNFLQLQVYSKILRTWAMFDLLEGKRADSMAKLAGSLHRGLLLAGSDGDVDRLIGYAIAAISSQGMLIHILNACETSEEFEALKPALKSAATRVEKLEIPEQNPVESPLLAAYKARYQDLEDESRERLRAVRARIALTCAAAEAKSFFVAEGRFPASASDFGRLLGRGLERDPFGEGEMRLLPEAEPFTIYSVGPDGKDDAAAITYDPTNGTGSRGDIAVRIPKEREFPFPREGVRASTVAEVQAIFPNGLPADIFAKTLGKQLGLTEDADGVYVYSFGPDVDEHVPRPAGSGAAFLEPLYDPTNGVTSNGDLWVKLKKP